jgi:cobalt-zinc-cadmium efflux system outer membrane protein
MIRLSVLIIAGTCAILSCGCAKVDPRPDYRLAHQGISEHTGVERVYDPDVEETVADEVTELLQDGLTVDEAVGVALLKNPVLQSLFHEIGASRADVVQAGLLTNPSFSLMGQFTEIGGRPKLNIGFGQELVDLWQIPLRKKIAREQLDQVVLNVVQHAVELAAQVKTESYRVIMLKQADEIAKENVSLVEKSLDLARERFEAGEIGRLDVDLIRTSLLETRLQRIDIQRQLRLAESSLANTLGLSRWEESWQLNDDLPRPDALPGDDLDLLAYALTQRLDARAAALSIRAREDEVRKEYRKIVPSVVVGAEWERPERIAIPGRKILVDTVRESIAAGALTAPTIESRAQRDRERHAIVDSLLGPAVQITLPIWDQNQAQIARARFRYDQERKTYESLLDRIAREVQDALVVVNVARQESHFYQDEVWPIARHNVEAAQSLYWQGETSITVLIDAQKALVNQRQAGLVVLRDYALGMVELERACGGRLPAAVASQPASQPVSVPSSQPQNNEEEAP